MREMTRNIKKYIYIALSLVFCFFTLIQPVRVQTANAWNPSKWAFCDLWGKWGPTVYKAGTTDWIQHAMASKSVTGESDNAKTSMYNRLLNTAGYNVGSDYASNPFDKFGLAGLKFSSYTGEWKYYDINPCQSGEEQVTATNFGEFYEGRLDPMSTYEEVNNTTDVRTKEYARGRMSALWKAMTNNFSNMFVGIAKGVVALTLALISISLSDLTELVGFGQQVQENMLLSFYRNIFSPLVVLMFLFTAGYLIYHGLIKREFRTAVIGGIIKPILCFLGAILISFNPSWVSLPNKLSVVIQSVIVSGLSDTITGDGSNDLCSQQTKNVSTDLTDQGFLDSQTNYMRSVIGCRIWSEYLFKPLIKGQFGVEYKDLDKVKNENEKWVGKPKVILGAKTIENWGLFYVSTMSGNHQPIDGLYTASVGGVNKDYYRIIDALSNYDEDVIKADVQADGDSASSSGRGAQASNAKEFIRKHADLAKKVADESGLYASVLLAQAALETGWGQALSADYNYFGIKCSAGHPCGSAVSTQEEVGGKLITIKSGFRKFSSIEDGFSGYARFLHGEGAGADFSGAFKKNASSPKDALLALKKAGYFTDSKYVTKAMYIINTYDLTQYDTSNKEGTNLSKYQGKNSSKSGSGGDSSTGTGVKMDIPIPKNNPPLKEWDDFIGNNAGSRLGYSLLMLLFSVIGSVAPLIFSLIASAYSLIITFLSVMAPIFLLLGCWGGRGNEILMRYFGTLASMFLKKLGMTFLLIMSILVITNTFELLNKVGVLKSLILLVVMTAILIKQRAFIVNKIAAVNMSTFSSEPMGRIANTFKRGASDTAQLGATAVIGGIGAKKGGGRFRDGTKEAIKHNVRQKLYRSDIGRRANMVYETYGKNKSELDDPVKVCVDCGIVLNEGDEVYIDENGNYFCDTCASALGYEGMSATFIDNENDEKYSLMRDNDLMEIEDENGDLKSARYLTRSELAEMGINDTGDWDTLAPQLLDRVNDSVILMYKDLGQAMKEGKEIRSPFIPEPLRNNVTNAELLHKIRKKDLDGYADIIEKGWEEWYTAQAEKHLSETEISKQDISKLRESFKIQREKYMG